MAIVPRPPQSPSNAALESSSAAGKTMFHQARRKAGRLKGSLPQIFVSGKERVATSDSELATRSFPLTNICGNEPFNLPALRRAWWNIVFPAAELDSSSALLGDSGGRGTIAIHIDHFSSVALVRWTHHQLRSEASATDRFIDSCVRLFAFYAANRRGQLFDKIFSAGGG